MSSTGGGVVEQVDASELTCKAIKARRDAFNHAFARNGGYKGYELQAIESLLKQLDAAEKDAARAMTQVRQLRDEFATLQQQADDWHRLADERAAEIVRLQGLSSDA